MTKFKTQNWSIRKKINCSFFIILSIMVIVSFISLLGLNTVTKKFTFLLDNVENRLEYAQESIAEIRELRRSTGVMIIYSELYDDDIKVTENYNSTLETIKDFQNIISDYSNNLKNDLSVDDQGRAVLEGCIKSISDTLNNSFIPEFNQIYQHALSDDSYQTKQSFDKMIAYTEEMTKNVEILVQRAHTKMDVLRNEAITIAKEVAIVILIIIIISTVLGIFISNFCARKLTTPIQKLRDASSQIANGNFDVNIMTNSTDEIGILSNNFAKVIDIVETLINDINYMSKDFEGGNINTNIDTNKYQGKFKETSESINYIVSSIVGDILMFIEGLNQYSNGNFEYELKQLPGKKAILNDSMDKLKDNILNVNESILIIINNINEGNLSINVDESKYSNTWKNIIHGLNTLVENVAEPIKETNIAMQQMTNSNLSYVVDESKFKGEFNILAKSINKTIKNLSTYIKEISDILKRMANQDLDVQINNVYIGDFKEIQDALQFIINNFNSLINEIAASSNLVNNNSKLISTTSVQLSETSSEQAAAVEELNTVIQSVADNAKTNTDNSLIVNQNALTAQDNANIVDKEMENLLIAMNEINLASNNISNILKVIEDIAFQTNILALNAAVEAARAGEHGKGFAVVADEVRTLASRSQQSAKETAELIETSLSKAQQGSNIANRTAKTLKVITDEIKSIAEISSHVAESSKEQNSSIDEINLRIKQISQIVVKNTSIAEESAVTSEEMSNQSELFNQKISEFKLKSL